MSYYEPPEDRGWDLYVDSLEEDEEPTGEGYEEWLEEQQDRYDDMLIEREEARREDAEYYADLGERDW